MMGLIIKVIVCPLAIFLVDILFTNVNYANVFQIIVVGIVVAVAGHTLEHLFLKKGTFWISNLFDFLESLFIVYLSQQVFRNALITFTGAVVTALVITATEYFEHLYLLRSGKVSGGDT